MTQPVNANVPGTGAIDRLAAAIAERPGSGDYHWFGPFYEFVAANYEQAAEFGDAAVYRLKQ